jgi:hypothetical protein
VSHQGSKCVVAIGDLELRQSGDDVGEPRTSGRSPQSLYFMIGVRVPSRHHDKIELELDENNTLLQRVKRGIEFMYVQQKCEAPLRRDSQAPRKRRILL